MLNEAEPNQKGFAFSTFTMNGEDAIHVAKVRASSYTKRNNRIRGATSVDLLVDFFLFF